MLDRIGTGAVNHYTPQPKQEAASTQLTEQRSEQSRQLAVKATQADHVKRLDSALNAWMNFDSTTEAKSGKSAAQVTNAYGDY